jgi:hypothetical protein
VLARLLQGSDRLASSAVATCRVPCNCLPIRRWPLFKARQLKRQMAKN